MAIDLSDIEEQLSFEKFWPVGWDVHHTVIAEGNPDLEPGETSEIMSSFYSALGLYFAEIDKDLYMEDSMENGAIRRMDFSEYRIDELQDPSDAAGFYCSLTYDPGEPDRIKAAVHLTKDQKQSDLGGFVEYLLDHSQRRNLSRDLI